MPNKIDAGNGRSFLERFFLWHVVACFKQVIERIVQNQ